MKTHQEHPSTSLVFYGVRRGVGTTTLAVNVATLLGIVARRRTLLLDLGGNEVRASTYLGVSSERGLLGLMTPFLKRGHISSEELAMQTVRYEPGAPWDRGVSRLDILCGFDRAHLSDAERDCLCADREAFLVDAVHKSTCLADYEFVIADGGTCSLGTSGVGLGFSRSPHGAVLVFKRPEDEGISKQWVEMLQQTGWDVIECPSDPALEPQFALQYQFDMWDKYGIVGALCNRLTGQRHPCDRMVTLLRLVSPLDPGLPKTMVDSQGRILPAELVSLLEHEKPLR